MENRLENGKWYTVKWEEHSDTGKTYYYEEELVYMEEDKAFGIEIPVVYVKNVTSWKSKNHGPLVGAAYC